MKITLKNTLLLLGLTFSQTILAQGLLPPLEPIKPAIDTIKEPIKEPVKTLEKPITTLPDNVKLLREKLPLTGWLEKLPDNLPIVNTAGKTEFTEVIVEKGARAVEREWLMMLDEKELDTLQKLPVQILEQKSFTTIGLYLLRFRVSQALDSINGLKTILPAHLIERLDRNHIYSTQSSNDNATRKRDDPLSKSICALPLKIGMIDTALERSHITFKKSKITEQSFLSKSLNQPKAHGTSVASLLVGTRDKHPPLLANASLFSASVFYSRNEYSQGATLLNLVSALNWLVSEDVVAINMSLTGPDNIILKKTIEEVLASGTAIVAAAGNQGPAAPPQYPAAYDKVITATAVDQHHKIYPWANQGDYIDFAAIGVAVMTAKSEGGYGSESGTSIATPIVSAYLACYRPQKTLPISEIISRLAGLATDLGTQGRDSIFGYGLLHKSLEISL